MPSIIASTMSPHTAARTRAVYNNRVVPVGLLSLWYLFQLTSPRLICHTQARISTVEPDYRRIHLIFWSPHRPPISRPKVMCMLRVVSGAISQCLKHSLTKRYILAQRIFKHTAVSSEVDSHCFHIDYVTAKFKKKSAFGTRTISYQLIFFKHAIYASTSTLSPV